MPYSPDQEHVTNPLGLFEGSSEIGVNEKAGRVVFDTTAKLYTVSGSGENMWSTFDEFFFVWKETSGDVTLAADIEFEGPGQHYHRKACLIVRQSLESDSAYADAALHGDGLAALQYRDTTGGTTHDIQSNITAPKRLRIEKVGDTVTMSVKGIDGQLGFSGGSVKLDLSDPYYVGIGICSHDRNEIETAHFSEVELEAPIQSSQKRTLFSTLETVAISSTDRKVVHVAGEHFEAPNWTPDGKALIYNGGGRLFRIPATGGTPTEIPTGFAIRCNNDHGISPDGTTLVISDQSQPPHQSILYTLPVEGGTPKQVTENFPSYWHGWSPDGLTLAFCGQRDGKYGIFAIPVEGGVETRLTITDGLDDGPDYSPDGKKIYFNSDRTGRMQIWRMGTDGSDLEQVTFDEFNNWFAHISPDGRWMVFLSYAPDVKGHPPDKDVALRLMALEDGTITILAKLFGGQGTINVPSWSPDSSRVAFVSYQYR